METRVSMTIKIDDESGNASLKVYTGKWAGSELLWNAIPYQESTIEQPIPTDQSILPYVVSILRNHSDRIVADLLSRIARGETFLMHECGMPQDS